MLHAHLHTFWAFSNLICAIRCFNLPASGSQCSLIHTSRSLSSAAVSMETVFLTKLMFAMERFTFCDWIVSFPRMFCTNTRQLVFKLNNQYAHLTCVFYSTQDTILNEYIVCSQDSISIQTQESLCTLLYSLVPRLLPDANSSFPRPPRAWVRS